MNSNLPPKVALIVPCYNEQQVLPQSSRELRAELQRLVEAGLVADSSSIYFVDDGSNDGTWRLIEEVSASDAAFVGIKLARNYGQQRALYAGLMEAEADAYITLDADLQDDVCAIKRMLEAFSQGAEIVYGVRDNRDSDTAFKRITAQVHYSLLSKLGIHSVPNHADFRLMSRRAVSFLSEFRETNLYLRGMVPLLGLRSEEVHYRRSARLAGDTKYSLRKMLSLSADGLTSFSIAPLRFFAILGFVVFLVSVALGIWALIAVLTNSQTVPGWASTVIPIYLIGGLQLLAVGVAGEYIGKIFMEAKARPLYQVEQRIGVQDDANS